MNNYLQVIKKGFFANRKSENLIVLALLFVILLIAVNYIFNNDNNEETSKNVISDNVSNKSTDEGNLESKIEEILNAINGVDNAKVVISYASTEKINPIYDTKEDSEQGNEGTSKTTTEKTVAYEEVNGEKVAIVESKDIAKAEGAIVVFTGSSDSSLILDIKTAVSAVTGISVYKIQVFQN